MYFGQNCQHHTYTTQSNFFFFFNRSGRPLGPRNDMSNPLRGLLICHPVGVAFTLRLFFRVASVVQPSASLPAPYAPLRGATPNPFGVRCNTYTFNTRVCACAYNFGLFLHVFSHFLRQGCSMTHPSGQWKQLKILRLNLINWYFGQNCRLKTLRRPKLRTFLVIFNC